jgi:hypothetical protein
VTGKAGAERAEHLQNNTQVADGLIAFEQIDLLGCDLPAAAASHDAVAGPAGYGSPIATKTDGQSYGSSGLKATIGFMRSAGIPENRS